MQAKFTRRFKLRLFIATVFRKIRIFLLRLKKYDVQYSTIIEGSVVLDKLYPQGIHIGSNTLVAGGVTILSHEHCKRVGDNQPLLMETYIGENCFVAVGVTILPGVKIGNQVIVGAGAVVTKNVPSNCVVAGNPAKIIRNNIVMNDFAALENWTEDTGWQ